MTLIFYMGKTSYTLIMSLSELINGNSSAENKKSGICKRLMSLSQKYITWKNINRSIGYIITVSFLLLTLLISSSLIYANFYRIYVPQMKHIFPVYFQFLTTENPEATIILNKPYMKNGVLYDIVLDLKIPDIQGLPEKVGNFMIQLDAGIEADQSKTVTFSSSRPSHLKFRSKPVKFFLTLAKIVPLMIGWVEETICQRVFLAESIKDPIQQNSGYISLILTSKSDLPIYEANLLIIAHLTGLRYVMYFWFFTAAFIGIILLTFIQAIICICMFIILSKNDKESKIVKKHLSKEIWNDMISDENDITVPDIGCAPSSIRQRMISKELSKSQPKMKESETSISTKSE